MSGVHCFGSALGWYGHAGSRSPQPGCQGSLGYSRPARHITHACVQALPTGSKTNLSTLQRTRYSLGALKPPAYRQLPPLKLPQTQRSAASFTSRHHAHSSPACTPPQWRLIHLHPLPEGGESLLVMHSAFRPVNLKHEGHTEPRNSRSHTTLQCSLMSGATDLPPPQTASTALHRPCITPVTTVGLHNPHNRGQQNTAAAIPSKRRLCCLKQ